MPDSSNRGGKLVLLEQAKSHVEFHCLTLVLELLSNLFTATTHSCFKTHQNTKAACYPLFGPILKPRQTHTVTHWLSHLQGPDLMFAQTPHKKQDASGVGGVGTPKFSNLRAVLRWKPSCEPASTTGTATTRSKPAWAMYEMECKLLEYQTLLETSNRKQIYSYKMTTSNCNSCGSNYVFSRTPLEVLLHILAILDIENFCVRSPGIHAFDSWQANNWTIILLFHTSSEEFM